MKPRYPGNRTRRRVKSFGDNTDNTNRIEPDLSSLTLAPSIERVGQIVENLESEERTVISTTTPEVV